MKGSARSGLSGNPSAPRRSSTTIPTPRPRPSVSQRSQELSTSSSSVPFSRSLPSSLSTCGIDRRRSTNESDRWRRAKQKKRSVVLYSLFECIIIIQDSNRPNFQVFFFNFQFFSIADSRFFFSSFKSRYYIDVTRYLVFETPIRGVYRDGCLSTFDL